MCAWTLKSHCEIQEVSFPLTGYKTLADGSSGEEKCLLIWM